MKKLIDLYRNLPTLTNREKLQNYILKHPMALCFLSADDAVFLRQEKFQF